MSPRLFAAAAALAFTMTAGQVLAATKDFRFEAIGKPENAAGKSVVLVRLVHISDGKPVPGAVLIESKADMGPAGMATMTAPVKALGEAEPGVYRFEIEPGMAGKHALTISAKVQGEIETVRGTVTVELGM